MLIFSFTFANVYDIINKEQRNVGLFYHSLDELISLETDQDIFVAYLLDLEESIQNFVILL